MSKLILIVLLFGIALADQGPPVYQATGTVPGTGIACDGNRVQFETATGIGWGCVSGAWKKLNDPTASFLLNYSNPAYPNATAVSSLATGLLLNTQYIGISSTVALPLSVANGGTGSTTAGATTQVLFNDVGVINGDAGLTYDKTNDTLTFGTANGTDAVKFTTAGARLRLSSGGTSDYLYGDGAFRLLTPGILKPAQIESNAGTATFLFHGLYATTPFVTPVWQFDNSYYGSGVLFSILDGPSGSGTTKVAYEINTSRTGPGPIQHTFGVTNSTASIQANAIITQGSTAGTAKLTLDEVFSGRLEGRDGTINYAPLIGTSSTAATSTSLVTQFYRSGDLKVSVCAVFADGHTSCSGPLAAVPSTATTACTAGQIAADVTYLYICYATNTWRRVATATW
jgi:hypothetical protein